MTDEQQDDPFGAQISRMIDALMNDGVAGATLGADGLHMGLPNWEERTKDQRFAQKVRTHGYPLGLSKSERAKQSRRVAELKDKVIAMNADDRVAFDAAFEALAYAIDAQRFLGSYNPRDRHSFDKDLVDTIALNIITWLEERGHRVVAIASDAGHSAGQTNTDPSSMPVVNDKGNSAPDDDAFDELGDILRQDNPEAASAAERLNQRLTNWQGQRWSERQREAPYSAFLFVPAKLHRQRMIEGYRTKLEALQGDERAAYRATHEALAYAIDAERFLRSVPGDDLTGDHEYEAINRYTNRLLAWLDDRGYEVVPKAQEQGE